jgi:DNA-directed RNA polymerase subunit RPC12/RpoP
VHNFTCKHCHKEFESPEKDRTFCSLSCSSKYNNTGIIRSRPFE